MNQHLNSTWIARQALPTLVAIFVCIQPWASSAQLITTCFNCCPIPLLNCPEEDCHPLPSHTPPDFFHPSGQKRVADIWLFHNSRNPGWYQRVIQVPPGQRKLVIEIEGANLGDLSVPNIIVSYNNRVCVDHFLGSLSPQRNIDEPYLTALPGRVVIDNPPAGNYFYSVWRNDNLPIALASGLPRRVTVNAEHIPNPPTISRITPAQQEKDLGTTAAIVVSASGQSLSYRWEKRKNGSTTRVSSSLNASAATATLSLANLAGADDAEYRAVVCNSGGCSTSAWSRLIVRLPPAIATQPQPRKVMPGNSATFSVTATGIAPLTYQWHQRDLDGNVRNLSGANSSGLTLNNVAYPARAGAYRVLVMNAANPAGLASQWASLTIGPDILSLSPANPSVTEGNSITLTVSAKGTAPLVYNWFHDGQLRQSGGSTQLSLASTREQDDGSWRLDVTNLAGKVSQTFTLDVIPPPTPPSFQVHPANTARTEGETLTLTSRAFGTRPIAYQWFHDGNPAGSGATLEIPNAGPEHAGQWKVRASNSQGQQESTNVTVSILPGPKFVRQPYGSEVAPGSTVSLSAEAIGRTPLDYLWFKNGQPLGITGPELTIANAALTDSGFYHVVVTNGLGNTLASKPVRVIVRHGAAAEGGLLWEFPCEDVQQIVINLEGDILVRMPDSILSLTPQGQLVWSNRLVTTQILSDHDGVTVALVHGNHAGGLNGAFSSLDSGVAGYDRSGNLLWSHMLPNSFGHSYYTIPNVALGAQNELHFSMTLDRGFEANHYGPHRPLYEEIGYWLDRHRSTLRTVYTNSSTDTSFSSYQPTFGAWAVSQDATVIRWGRFVGYLSPSYPNDVGVLSPSFPYHSGSSEWHLHNSLWLYSGTNWQSSSPEWIWLENFQGSTTGDIKFSGGYDANFNGNIPIAIGPGRWGINKDAEGSTFAAVFDPGLPNYSVDSYANTRPLHLYERRELVKSYYIGGDRQTSRGMKQGAASFVIAKDRRLLSATQPPEWWFGSHDIGIVARLECWTEDGTPIWAIGARGGASLDGFQPGFIYNPKAPPTLREDGTLLCYATARNTNQNMVEGILCVVGLDGTLRQMIRPGTNSVGSDAPITVSADGTIIGAFNGRIFGRKGTAPIMDSSWPIYGGNVRGTFRAQELPTVPPLSSQATLRGSTFNLNAASTGPQPIRYQWMRDGERIAGATNAALAVTDLRGSDSGQYQVRVSNPTGDRLSQPASLKVSFDPLPFVGVAHTPEAAFTNLPPSGNTHRDTWQFFQGINETNRTGRYARMEVFANPWQTAGLLAWSAAGLPTAAAGFNTSAAPVTALGTSVPPGRVFLNPGSGVSNCVGLAWQAEVAGFYSVTGRLSRLAVDASGDGVRWHLDVGTLNVLSGALPGTGTDTNLALAGLYLNRGERLHLILSPGDNDLGDLTGLELDVRLTEPDSNSEPGFLQSPQNLAVRAGQNAAFSAWVDGSPEPALQWQRSVNNGATWEALVDGPEFTGVNATNLEVFAVTLEANGHLFRVEAINAAGSAVSGVARLTVTDGPVAPSLVLQPQAAMTISGGLVILSAEASGTGPLAYQWYRDSAALDGQTGATLRLNAASPADAGAYYVVVANALGNQTSAVAVVTVDLPPPPPVIGLTATPAGAQVGLRGQAGSSWKIQRTATLGGPWESLAQVMVPLAAGGGIQPAGQLLGDVLWTDTNPPEQEAFYLAELAWPSTLPEINVQPLSSTFQEGGEGLLTLVVGGVSPISYQWWQEGLPLAGETNQTLTISDVTTNRAGYYFAVVSNAYGAVTSSVAVVTVEPAPFILKVDGILATATSELSNHGRYASNAVNGVKLDANFWETTHPALEPKPYDRAPAITFDLQGLYRLHQMPLWNSHEPGPAIKRMRVEYSRDGITFETFAEVEPSPGTGTEELSDVILLDQVEARFIRFSILENYYGQQFPFAGTPTNNPSVAIDEVEFYGELVAFVAPEFTTHPVGETNCLEGVSFNLSGAAIGTRPLSYQWWLNGQPVPNETNRTLIFNPITLAHAGRYNLVVSNGGGEVISAPAWISVVTNATTLPDLGGLLAYYAFNNSTNDLSGNGRQASNFGATLTRDRFGVLGGAFAFTNPSRMDVQGIDPDGYAGGFSFGCWFRPDSAVTSQQLFHWFHDGTWGSTFLNFGPGSLSIRCGSGSSATDHDISGLNMPVGQWHHLMVTHGTGFDRVYVNGTQVAEWPTSALLNNSSTLWIGNGVQGALDDVTIYGRELTAGEVQSLAVP